MSELYNYYVAEKKPSAITHAVVTDIKKGRLNGKSLNSLILEFEQKGLLDDTVIKEKTQEEWNEEYLELLSYETIGGTFSKQYLLHLADVAAYLSVNKARVIKEKKNTRIAFFIIAALAIIIFGIYFFIKTTKG